MRGCGNVWRRGLEKVGKQLVDYSGNSEDQDVIDMWLVKARLMTFEWEREFLRDVCEYHVLADSAT